MTYYMTSRRNSDIGYWEKCKAKTLLGAKREATATRGDGYLGATLIIATGDNITEPRREIASKPNLTGARWVDLTR